MSRERTPLADQTGQPALTEHKDAEKIPQLVLLADLNYLTHSGKAGRVQDAVRPSKLANEQKTAELQSD